jgi:hypothetical protein
MQMMSNKNKEPKWMTEEIGGKGNNKSKSNNKADNKESSTPSKPKTPAVPVYTLLPFIAHMSLLYNSS